MENARVITLDGVDKGFAIYLEDRKDFIREDEVFSRKIYKDTIKLRKIQLFKNLEVAKAYLNSKYDIYDPYEYKIWLIIDDKEIEYSNIQYIEPYYEYYDEQEIHYYIQESVQEKVISIGYFVFEDGDEKKICDPKIGTKKSKQLYNYIKEAVSTIISLPESIIPVEKIYRDSNGFLCLKLKGCTAKIHILYNSQIMDLNMNRKSDGIRCIPYNINMDKYKSIYIYITRDSSDYSVKYMENYTGELINLILDELNNRCPELTPRYISVNFNGNIFTGDNLNQED